MEKLTGKRSEHAEQRDLITWAQMHYAGYPILRCLYAIPNGGARHKAVAGKLRAEGVRPGVPDLHLPVPNANKCGLWIEMKAGRNKPTPHQLDWHERLRKIGHQVNVCYSWHEAAGVICDYLGLAHLKDNLQTGGER